MTRSDFASGHPADVAVPETMRVARMHAWGDVRVEEQPVPIVEDGDLLVRVDACGVCGSDALPWYVASKAPFVPGHEPVGTVVRAGTEVSRFAPGDRVIVHHHAPCGTCEECRRALWSSCQVWKQTRIQPGGFAEYLRVTPPAVESDTLHVPDSVDVITATMVEPLACCLRAVRSKARVAAHDTVLILGLGAMGLLMVQLARIEGAARVHGSDFLPERRALARSLGATEAFDPASRPGTALRDAMGGRGADVVIVCPGDDRAITAGLLAAAPGARVVCFTPLAPGAELRIDQNALYFREITLMQSYSCGPHELRAALELLADGHVDTRAIVTRTAGLDGVGEALAGIHAHDGLKTVILPHAR